MLTPVACGTGLSSHCAAGKQEDAGQAEGLKVAPRTVTVTRPKPAGFLLLLRDAALGSAPWEAAVLRVLG